MLVKTNTEQHQVKINMNILPHIMHIYKYALNNK